MNKSQITNTKLYVVCIVLTLVVFVLDLYVPLGVASAVPYISVILAALWSSKRNFAIHLAIVCTVMTLLGFYFSPFGGELWKVIFNRTLALFAIWVTALLIIEWKKHEEKIYSLNRKMELEKEKIYLATISSSQHILNNLLNQLQLVKMRAEEREDFDKETLSIFDEILEEGKLLMKKLSDVHEMDEDAIRQSVYPQQKSGE